MYQLFLQDRCLRCLARINEYGYLDTTDIHRLDFDGVTLRRVLQKLHAYEEHGYIHSTKLVVSEIDDDTNRQRTRRIPTVYYLTDKGVETLQELTGMAARRMSRSPIAPHTVHHRRRCVKIRLRFDTARKRLGITAHWTLEYDLRDDIPPDTFPPNRRRVLFHEFQKEQHTDGTSHWTVFNREHNDQAAVKCRTQEPGQKDEKRKSSDATCQPDIAVQFHRPPDTTPLPYFIEGCRSSESHQQLRRKLPGYEALLKTQDFHRYWPGIPAEHVRILWVFRSAQRLVNTIDDFRESPIARHFRYGFFKEHAALQDEGRNGNHGNRTNGPFRELPADARLFTDPVWFDANGNPISLLRQPT